MYKYIQIRCKYTFQHILFGQRFPLAQINSPNTSSNHSSPVEPTVIGLDKRPSDPSANVGTGDTILVNLHNLSEISQVNYEQKRTGYFFMIQGS